MTVQPTIHIVDRNLQKGTVQALTITVNYGDGVQADATVLLRPGTVSNDDRSIREEIERLGKALISAAQIPTGLTS